MLARTGTAPTRNYVGRFAPTPSGPLHFGSLVAAMASWLDARNAAGTWLVRIEDLDTPRNVPGAAEDILRSLLAFGMEADGEIVWQSRRLAFYDEALATLALASLTFFCTCTRKEIADSQLPGAKSALIYPGTCRTRPGQDQGALRIAVPAGEICFVDRCHGRQCQDLAIDVGDFVLRRADGIITYQLAVVVDDAAQGITHVVRGADLIDSTPRQIFLQRALGLATPDYLHVPVVVNGRGEKLSKQTGAVALDPEDAIALLARAACHLRLGTIKAATLAGFWREALLRYSDLEPAALVSHPAPCPSITS